MQFTSLPPTEPAVLAAACFAANAIGSDTPKPANEPTCKKLRRETCSQSRVVPVRKLSMAKLRGRIG
jgi:hypothetical protein